MEVHSDQELRELLAKATAIYKANFPNTAQFARAVFVSWYCSIGDCKFCYMSTQKEKIADPSKAKRRLSSVLAEIYLCKLFNWKLEFISAGYTGVTPDELEMILRYGIIIYGKKLWLNTGFMPKQLLERYLPSLAGVSGSIETLNPKVHDFVCPSKPIAPYEKLYEQVEALGLKKAITLIIGLGETKDDLQLTVDFIKKHNIQRITIYALRPVQGTLFTEAPDPAYYLWWLAQLRIAFPQHEIIGGIWHNDLRSLQWLFAAGVNHVTKYPALKRFGEDWQQYAGERTMLGNFTDAPLPNKETQEKIFHELSILDDPSLQEETTKKVMMYLRMIQRKQQKEKKQKEKK